MSERFFRHVNGFIDSTDMIGFSDDRVVILYKKDGTTKDLTGYIDLSRAEEIVQSGAWTELFQVHITLMDCRLIDMVNDAKNCEEVGYRHGRNHVAKEIFRNRKWRKVEHNGKWVETWYDIKTGKYMTESSDDDEADYSEDKISASVAHLWALYDILDLGAIS